MWVYSLEPRSEVSEVYCFMLNFNISNLGYFKSSWEHIDIIRSKPRDIPKRIGPLHFGNKEYMLV